MTVPAVQRNFTGGEWSPLLYGRKDLAGYANALRQMVNIVPRAQGGFSRRGGTRFVMDIGEPTRYDNVASIPRILPFQFSTGQEYAVLFADVQSSEHFQKRRFYPLVDGGTLECVPGEGLALPGSQFQWNHSNAVTYGAPAGVYYLATGSGAAPSFYNDGVKATKATRLRTDITEIEVTVSTGSEILTMEEGEWLWSDKATQGYGPDTGSTIYRKGAGPYCAVATMYFPEVTSPYHSSDSKNFYVGNNTSYQWLSATAEATVYPDVYWLSKSDWSAPGFDKPPYLGDTFDGEHPEWDGAIEDMPDGYWKWSCLATEGFGPPTGYTVYFKPEGGEDTIPAMEALSVRYGYVVEAYQIWGHTSGTRVDLFGGPDMISGKDFDRVQYVQSADILYLFHPSYPPKELRRYAHAFWQLHDTDYSGTMEAPYLETTDTGSDASYQVTAVGLDGEESLPSNAVNAGTGATFTWSEVLGADYYNIYKDDTGSGTYGWIGRAQSSTYTEVSEGVNPDSALTPGESALLFEEVGDYPSCGMFHQQRLVLACTDNKPSTFWGSVVGAFNSFVRSTPARADDRFEYRLASRQVNEIRWLAPINGDLMLGTSGAEWLVTGGKQNDIITPTGDISMKVQSEWGSSYLPPLMVGGTLLFVENADRGYAVTGATNSAVIRDLAYSFERDAYVGNDVTLLAGHIFENREVVSWAYQRRPDSVVWAVLDDGTMAGMTYYREHKVTGWHRHQTEGAYKNLCVLPSSGDMYMVVERNGRYLVEQAREALSGDGPMDGWGVDCGLRYDAGENNTAIVITGLDHLVGYANLDVVADGNVVPGLTVAEDGSITLPQPAHEVLVGLPYEGLLETMDIELPIDPGGTMQDKVRDISSVMIEFNKSRSLWVGTSEDDVVEVPFRDTEDYGEAVALFTGVKEVAVDPVPAGYGATVVVKMIDPLPTTVLSLTPKVAYDDLG